MDILKILSRSTKHVNKSGARKDATSLKLPSAGTSSNPQLYHDAVPDSRGKKRKRGVEHEEEKAQAQVEEAIDFFATKTAAPKSKTPRSLEQAAENELAGATAKLLEEEECRQILRSHRLKITFLPPSHAPENKIKKSKKSKATTKSKTKDEYKQVYPQPLTAFGDLKTTYGI